MLIVNFFIQLFVILLLAPLVNGIIKKIKAFSQKRKGPPVFQLYFDLIKLLKKDVVVSKNSSWIFKVTPYIVLITSLLAAMMIPVTYEISQKYWIMPGDIIVVISLIGLGRFFMVLAGLDTGSTFGGMGSSREVMVSSLFEPALMVSIFTLALTSGSTSIGGIMKYMSGLGFGVWKPAFLLVFLAIFIILIAEAARTPVDDPATHLELTMIHEAMVLEYSGKYLAMMEYGNVIKQLFFITILVNFFMPSNFLRGFYLEGSILILAAIIVYILKVVILSAVVAIVEVSTVKLRLFRISELATFSFIAAFLSFLQLFVIGGK